MTLELKPCYSVCIVSILNINHGVSSSIILGVYDNEEIARARVDEWKNLGTIGETEHISFFNEMVWGVRD